MLINLLKNAVEAGGAAEDVELEIGSDADGFTRFEVRDRGAGFSDEALGSALLPFYSTKPQGSGLGLALCREIVEAHGGSLHVSNREGGGAVVCVLVPGKPKLDASVTRSRARLTLSTA